MSKRVLVLSAHLDDSVIAVGGLIRRYLAEGSSVSVVCFGNGDEAFTKPDAQAASMAEFQAEAERAHERLGVTDLVRYDVPDFGVQLDQQLYRWCIKEIRRVRPQVVLGHYPAEYFQHHAMAKVTEDACWQAGWNCSADLGEPWTIESFYRYEVLHDLPEPTHIVDVSDHFQAKLDAWGEFATAAEHLDLRHQLECRARYHGSKIGVEYAEVLKRSFAQPVAVADLSAL